VEGAGGLGHLLAQQLLSAGERVLDVPPKLAARVRLLATGDINKNDPNDARSVAVAALRSAQVREARRDDHAAVLKVWSKRYVVRGSAPDGTAAPAGLGNADASAPLVPGVVRAAVSLMVIARPVSLVVGAAGMVSWSARSRVCRSAAVSIRSARTLAASRARTSSTTCRHGRCSRRRQPRCRRSCLSPWRRRG
jgi:hypothetical protein